MFGRGGGGGGGQQESGPGIGPKGLLAGGALALLAWFATGIYTVQQDQLGVETVFGKVNQIATPGLNYNWPSPIGAVFLPRVTQLREITIGLREADTGRGLRSQDVLEESLMLTGDENIVDIDFKVQWAVKTVPLEGVSEFLFNIEQPELTVRAVAESAMREAIGRTDIQRILTEERARIEQNVRELMQKILDGYKAGIDIRLVQMQKVDPPSQVVDAFRDVQAARADAERVQNEAQSYANRVVPEARGEAARIIEAATGYKTRIVEEARGQADRFLKVYEEYRKAPEVTRERLYLETMERVLGGMDKVILDAGNQNVVPYLPLDQLIRPPAGAQTPAR